MAKQAPDQVEFQRHLETLKERFIDVPLQQLHALLTRSYYEARIQLKRRQWPWHLRVPNIPFLKNHQRKFYDAMFGLLAQVARVDGKICAEEREAVQNFAVDDLRLSANQVIAALTFFREAAERNRSFESCARELAHLFRLRAEMRRNVVDALIDMAYADKRMNIHEDRLIRQAVHILGLTKEDYDKLKQEYAAEEALRDKLSDFEERQQEAEKEDSHAGSKRWNRRSAGANPAEELLFSSGHYDVLGCSPTDTVATIKKRYRKLVLQHHPDRLAAQGLPEEFRDAAKKKFREIQEAYELIQEERGFS